MANFGSGNRYQQQSSSPYILCVEGENVTTVDDGEGTYTYDIETDIPDASGDHIALTPRDSNKYTAGDSNAPRFFIEGNFETTGTHYIYARCAHGGLEGKADSFHYRLNSNSWTTANGLRNRYTPSDSFGDYLADEWIWCDYSGSLGGRVTVNIPSTGDHTLEIQMRENGLHIDRLYLSTDSNRDDRGTQGPTESSTVNNPPTASLSLSQV